MEKKAGPALLFKYCPECKANRGPYVNRELYRMKPRRGTKRTYECPLCGLRITARWSRTRR